VAQCQKMADWLNLVFRALMGAGDGFVAKTHRSSLCILGTVGEPINPEAWEWYYHKIGNIKVVAPFASGPYTI
jgi:acyl-coenzyme A synthetase/AMP-(fatty) acid ligase